MRRGRGRRGTRGDRGGAGRGAAGRRNPCVHRQSGRGGQHALQSRHRRHRQGASGPGDRRPGRGNGEGRGRGRDTIPDAESGQGAGGPFPPRPVRPAALSGAHEALPGAPGASAGGAGGGGGRGGGGGPGPRRRDRQRRPLALPRGCDRHGDLSPGTHRCGGSGPPRRAGRAGRSLPALGEPARPGPGAAALQNRDAPPGQRPQRGLFKNDRPAG